MDTSKLPAVQQAGLFFKHLFAPYREGYVELRMLYGKKREQAFVKLPCTGEDLRSVCELVVERAQSGYDVYCGVLPRSQQSGKASAVNQAATVWVDLDYKNMNGDEIDAATEGCDMVVRSGGGVHAYWWGAEVVELANKGQQDNYAAMVQAHQAEVSAGKADSTHDIPRILRVPGTLNWKDRLAPRPVVLEWCNPRKKQGKPLPVPHADPEWEEIVGLWASAAEWTRLMDAAKRNHFPQFSPPLKMPSGVLVSDLNVFLRGCWHLCALPHDGDTPARSSAERDVDFVTGYLKEYDVAY